MTEVSVAAERSPDKRTAFRPCLLLLAPFLATLPMSVSNMRVFRDVSSASDEFGSIAVAMMVSCLVAAIVGMLVASSRHPVGTLPTGVTIGASFVYIAAQCVMWGTGILLGHVAHMVPWCIGTIMGVASIPVFSAWVACYELDFKCIMLHGSLAGIAAAALVEFFSILDPMPTAIAWCVCAAIGTLAPMVMTFSGGDGGSTGRPSDSMLPGGSDVGNSGTGVIEEKESGLSPVLADFITSLWLPLLGLLLCVACSCIGESDLGGRPIRGEVAGLLAAGTIAFVLCRMHFATPFVLLVDKLVVPALCACAVMLCGLPPEGAAGTLGAYSIFVPLMFMSIYALASAVAIHGFSRLFVVGTVLAACCLSMLAGTAVRLLDDAGQTGMVIRAVTCFYYAVVLMYLGISSWRSLVRPRESIDASGTRQTVDTIEAAHQGRVADMAVRFGLTEREREIMGYLTYGYSANYIAKTLFISGNTVRTHMRNIYRKTGVNSREELLSLFNLRQ